MVGIDESASAFSMIDITIVMKYSPRLLSQAHYPPMGAWDAGIGSNDC